MSNSWPAWLDGWTTWMVAARRPSSTRRLRTHQIRDFAADIATPPADVTTKQLIDWMASKTSWSVETLRSNRAAIRGLYRHARASGWIDTDPTVDLPALQAPRHLPRPAPEDVVRAALTDTAPRVRLMVDLAARHGLRRAEIAHVHTDHLVQTVGGWALHVVGKGSKPRLVPLQPDTAARLRMLPAGWAFPGRIDGHLSPGTVGKLVTDALPGAWTTHTLRHRFGTRAYAGSKDLAAVQELMGHVSITTTRGYVGVGEDEMRSAAAWAA